jgi:hypothetical protein
MDIALAWWGSLLLLGAPLLWALNTRWVSLITICGLSLLTQFITLPFFYLDKDDFAWSAIKPFGFSAAEAYPMLFKVSAFLFLLNIFYRIFDLADVRHRARTWHQQRAGLLAQAGVFTGRVARKVQGVVGTSLRPRAVIALLALVLLIPAFTVLNLWTFSLGVGVVGVEPPRLPYHLSGILLYFFKYVVPLVFGYLYARTHRGWLPAALVVAYGWILGMTSLSRSSLMYCTLPVLFFAAIDRRRMLLIVTTYFSLLGYGFITRARGFVHFVSDGQAIGNFDTDVFSILVQIAGDPGPAVWNPLFVPGIFVELLNRLDGFENLVMAEYYDVHAVNGPLAVVLGLLWSGFAPLDSTLHHIQWNGSVPAEGYFNGGGLLSTVVMLGGAGFGWLLMAAAVVSVLMVILEKAVRQLRQIGRLQDPWRTAFLGFLAIFYFNSSGGQLFIFLLLLVVVAAAWPSMRLGNARQLFRTSAR